MIVYLRAKMIEHEHDVLEVQLMSTKVKEDELFNQ
jgi:hypothetical protein